MGKQFKLIKNKTFGNYYIANSDFTSESYEMDNFGVIEYYTDSVVFTGTIKEIVYFFIEHKKRNLMKGWGVSNLSTQDLKWINNAALNLIKEISEC